MNISFLHDWKTEMTMESPEIGKILCDWKEFKNLKSIKELFVWQKI
jgi:hypothetical protein